MSKKILLTWDKPHSLAALERERDKHKPLQSGLLILKISLVLHAMALVLVYTWENERLSSMVIGLFLSSLLMPIYHYLGMRGMCLSTERHYEFREDGILYVSYSSKVLYRWKSMRSYSIEQNPELPQLMNLIVISGWKWSPVRCQLVFDPIEVPEEEIKVLLDEKIIV